MAKRKKKRGRRKAPVRKVTAPRRKKGLIKGEFYRINVPGTKGYGTFEQTAHSEEGQLVHVFRSTEPEQQFHIPADKARGIYRVNTAAEWRKFHDVRYQRQSEMVRKYKLSHSDRTLLMKKEIKKDCMTLQSSRTRNAIEKLSRLGLVLEGNAGWTLTQEGMEAGRRIFSSSSGTRKTAAVKKEEPCETRTYTFDEYMKLLGEVEHERTE